MDKQDLGLVFIVVLVLGYTGYAIAQPFQSPGVGGGGGTSPIELGARPCDFHFSIDSLYHATNCLTGNKARSGPIFATIFADTISQCPATGCKLTFGRGPFSITTTLTLDRPVTLQGMGAGLLWNAGEDAPTELKWAGSSNNIPLLQITDTTLSEGITVKDLKLFYSGSTTGTDGIYIDGVTSVARRIDFYNVNIQSFTGYCVNAIGTTFDIHYFSLGCMSSAGLGGVLVNPGAGTPSQHFFYGPIIIENVAGAWAMNITSASQSAIFGGTVANGLAGGNGLFLKGLNGFTAYNVNFEGANAASTTGILYDGTGMTVQGGTINDWATGINIGPSPSGAASATNWYVDSNFNSNTADVLITAGGSRNGILGPISDNTLSTITNNRATTDGVYSELLRIPLIPPGVASITPGASPYTHTNQDFYKETIYISGGTVSGVTKSGSTVCSATNCAVFLAPGQSLIVTYSVLPTMIKDRY